VFAGSIHVLSLAVPGLRLSPGPGGPGPSHGRRRGHKHTLARAASALKEQRNAHNIFYFLSGQDQPQAKPGPLPGSEPGSLPLYLLRCDRIVGPADSDPSSSPPGHWQAKM
jgi:hypothetical protein